MSTFRNNFYLSRKYAVPNFATARSGGTLVASFQDDNVNRTRMKKIFCLLLLLFSAISFSQSVTGEGELYEQYQKVDKELNSVYNKLLKGIKETDKKNLVAAQKAWIKFRDLDCKFQSQDPGDGGGTYENKMKIDCLIRKTAERIKELQNLDW
jgi:hypothetical protein